MFNLLTTLFYLLLAFSPFIHATEGSGGDNGGDLEKINAFQLLSEQEVRAYLTTDSIFIKKAGVNLISFLESYDYPLSLEKRIESMIGNAHRAGRPLIEGIRFANFDINETNFLNNCSAPKINEACTSNNVPGSTIYFSIKNIMKSHPTFAALVGLFMHEVSRHYIGEADNDHKLGQFFTQAVISKKHLGNKIFTTEDLIEVRGGKKYYPGYSGGGSLREASLICKEKGFAKAKSSSIKSFNTDTWSFDVLVYYYDDGTSAKIYLPRPNIAYDDYYQVIVCSY